MKIVCDTDFKHGTEQFHKDDVRAVSDEDGAYFAANGWAHALGDDAAAPAADATSTDLDVQNNTHNSTKAVK